MKKKHRYISVCLSACVLSAWVRMCAFLCTRLPNCLLKCLSVCLSVYLSVCLLVAGLFAGLFFPLRLFVQSYLYYRFHQLFAEPLTFAFNCISLFFNLFFNLIFSRRTLIKKICTFEFLLTRLSIISKRGTSVSCGYVAFIQVLWASWRFYP